jgi:Tfp pilus assembly protein PilZ
VPIALSVQLRFADRAEALSTRTVDLSHGGLFIALDPPKPIGTQVRVAISVASTGEQFFVEGVVIHRRPDDDCPLPEGGVPGIGVYLTSASEGYARFCSELAAKKDEPGSDD